MTETFSLGTYHPFMFGDGQDTSKQLSIDTRYIDFEYLNTKYWTRVLQVLQYKALDSYILWFYKKHLYYNIVKIVYLAGTLCR